MQLKDQVEVLILTINRHEKLRLMVNYIKTELGLNIIVADGSDVAYPGNFDGDDAVTYLHRPKSSVMSRIVDGSSACSTPYCLMSADDDFVLLDGTKSCVAALNNDPGASVAVGSFYQYQVHSANEVDIKLLYLVQYLQNLFPRRASQNIVGRMEYLTQNIMQLVWAVHRTTCLYRIAQSCVKKGAEETYLGEGCLGYGLALQGDYIVVPEASCVRSIMPRNADPLARPQRHVFSNDPNIKATYTATLEALAELVEPSLDEINAKSRYEVAFRSKQEWLDALFRDKSLHRLDPPPSIPKVQNRRFDLPDLELFGTLDDGLVIGDVDTTIETFVPVLRHARETINDHDTFAKRFNKEKKPETTKDGLPSKKKTRSSDAKTGVLQRIKSGFNKLQ